MIDVVGLCKSYGAKKALCDVSFKIGEGEIVGLLGLNGAGKSTAMNILAGYMGATSGTVRIAGFDVLNESQKARGVVGYLPEQPPVYPDMTTEEYLRFVWALYGRKGDRRASVEKAMDATDITPVKKRLIRNLSKGYRQRIGIAQAILPEPKVLILDEPSVGLDPTQVVEMRSLIRSVAKNTTVIVSSHILSEIQAVCSRVLVLNEGRLIADDKPEALAGLINSKRRVAIRVMGERSMVESSLMSICDVELVEFAGQKEPETVDFFVKGAPERDVRVDVFEVLSQAKLPLIHTYGNEPSLEDIFLRLIEHDRLEGA